MKMDRHSSDQSPTLSDSVAAPWMNYWQNELGSVSGLNIDNSRELNKLVEDKEVAAKAVAFVVNSSRKGIVPLCADVAHLLRAKKSLESKLTRIRSENELLRHASMSGSARTSHSTSPTPPSLHSLNDRHSLSQDQSIHTQESPPLCPNCSVCPGSHHDSPKLSKFQEPHLPQPHQRESVQTVSGNHSNHNMNNRTFVTKAEVHSTVHKNGLRQDTTIVDMEHDVCNEINDCYPLTRKNSLPEIVSKPCGNVPKVSPRAIKCKGTQCMLLTTLMLEEREQQSTKLNCKLTEELNAAKREIEVLRHQLKELEMNKLAGQLTEKYYHDNDCEMTEELVGSDDEHYFLPVIHKPQNSRSSPHLRRTKKSSSCPFTLPGPLSNCRCDMCETLIETGNAEVKLKSGTERKSLSSSLQIKLNDYVVVKGKRTGHVRYIGHLDNYGQPNAIFVGLELDAPVGKHDGTYDGKHYFECKKDHGIILPLHDVICIVCAQRCASSLTNEVCKKKSFKDGKRSDVKVSRQESEKHGKSGSDLAKVSRQDSEKHAKPGSEVRHSRADDERSTRPHRGDLEKCSRYETERINRHSKSEFDRFPMAEKKTSTKPERQSRTDPDKATVKQSKTDSERMSKNDVHRYKQKADSPDSASGKLLRKDSDKRSRADVYRIDAERQSRENCSERPPRTEVDRRTETDRQPRTEMDRHKDAAVSNTSTTSRKATQAHDKKERLRLSEKRRAHESAPVNRDFSLTDGQTV